MLSLDPIIFITKYDLSFGIDPKKWIIRNFRAPFKRHEEALAAFDQVIRLDPNYASA
jgi:hypothetical protein